MYQIIYTYTNGRKSMTPMDAHSEWAARNIFDSRVKPFVNGITYASAELLHNGKRIAKVVA